MLFHVRHHHAPGDCITHQPDEVKRVVGAMMKKAADGVVKVHSFVLDAPHHDLYWVVEAGTVEALHDFLDSGMEWGNARIVPVVDGLAAIKARTE